VLLRAAATDPQIPDNPQNFVLAKTLCASRPHNFHFKHLTIVGRRGGEWVRGRVLLTEIEGEGTFGEQIAKGLLFLCARF
ncbi:MAG: hypothetical protein WB041_23300, partial [Pseudolabrys sp.]